MNARIAAARARQGASWRARRCFVCSVPIPEAEGTYRAALNILVHDGICTAMVTACQRDYTRSRRGRALPRREILTRILEAVTPALEPARRWDFERQISSTALHAANLLLEMEQLERQA